MGNASGLGGAAAVAMGGAAADNGGSATAAGGSLVMGSSGSSTTAGAPGGGAIGSGGSDSGSVSGAPSSGGKGSVAGAGAAGALPTGGKGGATGTGGAGPVGGLSWKDFSCTQIHGVSSISAWFGGGFEMEPGIDSGKWQAMATHAAFVEKWTDPNDAVWSLPIQSPCSTNSKTPDRIIFNPVNWHYQTEAEWETAIDKVIVTIKAKYPAVKRIELITMVRSPNNPTPCTTGGASVEQTVLPTLDQAIDAVAAKSGPLVTVGPKLVAPSCAVYSGTTANFNSSSYGTVAKMVASAFVAEP